MALSGYRLRGHQTGPRAIAELRKLTGHDLPALMVTGDTAPDRLEEASDSDIALLHKRLAPAQLRRALAAGWKKLFYWLDCL